MVRLAVSSQSLAILRRAAQALVSATADKHRWPGSIGARHLTAGAFVRRAIVSQLEDGATPRRWRRVRHGRPGGQGDAAAVGSARGAAGDARGSPISRKVPTSPGLIEGAPPAPLPPDHTQAVGALVRSTDQLAVLSADINGFLRALPSGQPDRLEPYRRSVFSLTDDVCKHLAVAARC